MNELNLPESHQVWAIAADSTCDCEHYRGEANDA